MRAQAKPSTHKRAPAPAAQRGRRSHTASIRLGSTHATTLAAHAFSPKDLGQRVAASYFQDVAQALIGQADEALYRAKKLGGGALCPGAPTQWLPLRT